MTTPPDSVPPVAPPPPQQPMPPQGYPPYGYGMPPYAVQPPTSTSAILSLIFSIAGFVIVPIIGGIVGVILGNSAKKEIANSGGTVGGAGLAQAGVIIGWINIALISIPVCVIVVLALLGPVIGTTFSQINASL